MFEALLVVAACAFVGPDLECQYQRTEILATQKQRVSFIENPDPLRWGFMVGVPNWTVESDNGTPSVVLEVEQGGSAVWVIGATPGTSYVSVSVEMMDWYGNTYWLSSQFEVYVRTNPIPWYPHTFVSEPPVFR